MSIFVEGRYSERQLRINRRVIVGLCLGGIGACFIAAGTTDWEWARAIGMSVVIAVFAGCLWWLFASRSAGPVGVSSAGIESIRRTFWGH